MDKLATSTPSRSPLWFKRRKEKKGCSPFASNKLISFHDTFGCWSRQLLYTLGPSHEGNSIKKQRNANFG
jgi:hypothetical protein